MAKYDFKSFVSQFVVTEIKKNAQTLFRDADFNFDNLKCDVEFSHQLNGFVVFATQGFYSTQDSSRFETKEEKKEETAEHDVDMVPATLMDHIKHNIVSFLTNRLRWRWKIKWISVNYIPTKHIVVKHTFITKHITILEFTCPHMKLPGHHQNHVLHLAQGVPSLRSYVREYPIRPY